MSSALSAAPSPSMPASSEAVRLPDDGDALVAPWSASLELAVVTDAAGRVVAVNQAFARKFGVPRPQWPGRELVALLHPDDAADWRMAGAALPLRPFHINREHRWQTAQGWRWLSWEETLLWDDNGRPCGVRSIGRDVTKRRLAEEHFSKLATAVQQSPVSIVMTAPDGRVQYVNPRFTEVTGYTLEEIFEQDIPILRHGHPTEISYQQFWQTVRQGRSWRGELCTPCKQGGHVWEFVQVSPIRNHVDEITHLLCLREDISERKRLEDQLRQAQKMESIGTLAGGIAHDFNNLIAIVKGYAEIAIAKKPDAAIERYVREILGAAQRAAGLVRQILTFSRKTETAYRPVDLNGVITDLARMMSETFPRTITFDLQLDPKLNGFAADQNQLQQVFLNLCVNARDAMPRGGSLTLATSVVTGLSLAPLGGDPAQEYVCIRVSDTGEGMTPEVRGRIFEPFFTTKQGRGGTGLGLAVVYGVIANHHGLLDVASEPGRGSTFLIYLPLARTTAEAPREVVGTVADIPGGHERVLIVDDENALRELLRSVLAERGYVIEVAENGTVAADRLTGEEPPPDAVLLDLNLPGINGADVCRLVRTACPQTPVLVISGHITPEVKAELAAVGQHEFIGKPYSLAEVGLRLRAILDAKRQPS